MLVLLLKDKMIGNQLSNVGERWIWNGNSWYFVCERGVICLDGKGTDNASLKFQMVMFVLFQNILLGAAFGYKDVWKLDLVAARSYKNQWQFGKYDLFFHLINFICKNHLLAFKGIRLGLLVIDEKKSGLPYFRYISWSLSKLLSQWHFGNYLRFYFLTSLTTKKSTVILVVILDY